MAFGSFFKKLKAKIVNGVKKALPTIRKIIDVGRQVIPVIAPIIGGNAGKRMGQINDFINRVNPQVSNEALTPGLSPIKLNADRFSTPMLK